MNAEPHGEFLFTSDDAGNVTHLRGVELPPFLLHAIAVSSLSDRSPTKDSEWVVRGAYRFAKRVQGEAPPSRKTDAAKP